MTKQRTKCTSPHTYGCTQRFGRSRDRLINPTTLPERRTICARSRQQTFGALRACQPVLISRTPSAQRLHLDSSWSGIWLMYHCLKECGTSTSLV
jgi:hypothetical protein